MRLLAVALAAAVLAGAATAAPAPAPVRKQTAKDMKLAHGALLVPADFGKGWTASKLSTRPQTLSCPGFAPDLHGVVETGTASRTFRGATAQGVGQAVWVYRSSEQARLVWSRSVGKGLLGCLVGAARHAGGLTVTRIASGELVVPKLAARSAGFRLIVTARVKGRTLKLYYDTLLLAAGRTVTELTFGSSAPIASAVELTLARATAKRLGTTGAA
jgi:hypothetical protein